MNRVAHLSAVLIMASSGPAAADEQPDPWRILPDDPPPLHLTGRIAGSGPVGSFHGGIEAYGFLGRLLWTARTDVQVPLGSHQYQSDPNAVYELSDGGPQVRVGAQLGFSLWRRQEWFALVDGAIAHRLQEEGYIVTDEFLDAARSHDELMIVGAASVSVLESFELAIPVGLRFMRHDLRPKRYAEPYRDWWIQARAVIVPGPGKIGVDAEVALPWYGLYLFSELFPALDTGAADCGFDGLCDPPYSPSAFDVVPGESQLVIGGGLRLGVFTAL